MESTSIADWSGYLAAQAGAGATLTGLVFVAVSINLSRILSIPGLTGRAAESLTQFLGVVILSTTALIPKQPAVALGSEVLGIGVALWVIQTSLQFQYRKNNSDHPRSWVVSRVIQTQFACVPFIVSGILILRGSSAGLYWLAPGFAFTLIAGLASAWVLMVEILR